MSGEKKKTEQDSGKEGEGATMSTSTSTGSPMGKLRKRLPGLKP